AGLEIEDPHLARSVSGPNLGLGLPSPFPFPLRFPLPILVDGQHPIGPGAVGCRYGRHMGRARGTGNNRNNASKRHPLIDRLKLAYDDVAGRAGNVNRLVRAVGEEKDASGWIDEFDVEGCQRMVRQTGVIWSW